MGAELAHTPHHLLCSPRGCSRPFGESIDFIKNAAHRADVYTLVSSYMLTLQLSTDSMSTILESHSRRTGSRIQKPGCIATPYHRPGLYESPHSVMHCPRESCSHQVAHLKIDGKMPPPYTVRAASTRSDQRDVVS